MTYRTVAIESALESIKLQEARIVALHFACGEVRNNGNPAGFAELHALMYRNLNEAYRRLLIFGILVKDDVQDRVRAKVMRRYLDSGTSIMAYLHIDGECPSIWSGEDEKAFRQELEKL